jgi:hypothetical protein
LQQVQEEAPRLKYDHLVRERYRPPPPPPFSALLGAIRSAAPCVTSRPSGARYPTFVDALHDLDDCLCLISLFANFPQTNEIQVGPTGCGCAHRRCVTSCALGYGQASVVERCRRLSNEFLLYAARARALRKVFLSIKGIYYQVEIQGQTITWIAPYQFTTDASAALPTAPLGPWPAQPPLSSLPHCIG